MQWRLLYLILEYEEDYDGDDDTRILRSDRDSNHALSVTS